MMDFYRVLGQRIRQARKESRYSQAELGRLLGYSANAILGWEKGTRRINIEDLMRLAAILDRPLSFFLEGITEEPRENERVGQVREAFSTYVHSVIAEAMSELKGELTRTFHEIIRSQEFREAVVAAVKEGVSQLPQFLPKQRQLKARR
ncbi:MAG: helix-turn-helix transcriptional regulator [Armatimonadota bacterium]|nr:helix-turn-helix transcriptional regulator [Armatimonadota bacterium]